MEQTVETINGVNKLTKVCSKCGNELPLESFPRNAKSQDGHLNTCKKCHAESIRQGHLKKKETMSLPVKGVDGGNPELARFTPRQLIDELRSRGFVGDLEYVYRIKV